MCVTNRIKEIRKLNKIRQEDLAKGVQCDIKSISRYETGKRNPSLELALRISKYLPISTDELFKVDT